MAHFTTPEGKHYEAERATVRELLEQWHLKKAIGMTVGGEVVDCDKVFTEDTEFAPLFPDCEQGLELLRHSTAHLLAHAVLRGAVDGYGNDIPNFHYETVMKVIEGYSQTGLKHPAIIIDTNHSNSGKQFKQQIRIVEEVLNNRLYDRDFKKYVKGFMIESFIEEGSQKEDVIYGKSITDPCLGWEDTERLVLDIANKV